MNIANKRTNVAKQFNLQNEQINYTPRTSILWTVDKYYYLKKVNR